MAVTFKSVGQFVTSTTTDPAPSATDGPAAGDRSLMFVGVKPITATLPTPADWTLIAGPVDGGIGSQGADTGPTRMWVFQRDGAFSGAQPIALSGGNSGFAVIITFQKSLDAWSTLATTTGDDTTGGSAAYAATYAADPGITAGDALAASIAIPTDASTLTVQSPLASPSLTATGITGGTTGSKYGETGTGFDFGTGLIWRDGFTGTASAAPAVAATFTAATNTYGVTILVRLRDEAAGTNLVPDDALHGHTADAPALTQKHSLASAEALHGHTADAPTLTQNHVLAVDSALHGHTADSPTLSSSVMLAVDPATHAHTADAPALTQKHSLVVDPATHGHTADAPALTQNHVLAVDGATHAHTADEPTLSGASTPQFPGDPGDGNYYIGWADGPGADGRGSISAGQANSQNKLGVYHNYSTATNNRLHTGMLDEAINAGLIPSQSFKLASSGGGSTGPLQILAGDWDTVIDGDAQACIDRAPWPIWLCYFHEPGGDFTDDTQRANYRAAFRYIVARYRAAGVTNVMWTQIQEAPWDFRSSGRIAGDPTAHWYKFHPDWKGTLSGGGGTVPNASDWYTGEDQVCDIFGLDIYNPLVGGTSNQPYAAIWNDVEARWSDHGFPIENYKGCGIFEMGWSDVINPDPNWVSYAVDTLVEQAAQNIKVFTYWNNNNDTPPRYDMAEAGNASDVDGDKYAGWQDIVDGAVLFMPPDELVAADAAHAHTADAVTLTQKHSLTVDPAVHAHTADQPVLTQTHSLAPADALHAHTADASTVTEEGTLLVASAGHAHTADAVLLTQAHSLAVESTTHAHFADEATFPIPPSTTYTFNPPHEDRGPLGYDNTLLLLHSHPFGIALVRVGSLYVEKKILHYENDVLGKVEGYDYFRGGYRYTGITQEVADMLIASGYLPIEE